MAKLNWTKPSAETVAYFERIAPGPPIQARRMFGMPSRFLNGHMLVSVFGDAFMLHLSETDREECIAAGARPFAPMGRMAKEYVEIVPGHFPDQTLKEWIARGMRYLGSLPPKLEAMRKEEPRASGPLSVRTPTKKPSAAPKSASAAKKETAVKAKPKAKATTVKAAAKVAKAKAKPKTQAVKATAKVAKAKPKAKAKPARAVTGRAAKKPKKKRVAKKSPARRGRR